jgi:hypothetical protein
MSLDDLFEIMSWPIGERDPFRPSVRNVETPVVFTICLKALLDGGLSREAARGRDRERFIANLAHEFRRGTPPVDSKGKVRAARRGSARELPCLALAYSGKIRAGGAVKHRGFSVRLCAQDVEQSMSRSRTPARLAS